MDDHTSRLISMRNTSQAKVAGINPGETRVVFCSPTWVNGSVSKIVDSLASGVLVGLDLCGWPLPTPAAIGAVLALSTAGDNLRRDCEGASAYLQNATRVRWNIDIYPNVVAAVRSDMLVNGLAGGGTNAQTVLSKLSNVVTLIALGMFQEAAYALTLVPPDGFLTKERLALYQAMLCSADALAV